MRAAEESLVFGCARLRTSLSHLRVRLALGAPAEPAARLVQAFRDRLLAADVAADLSEAHRDLMTIYPSVDADLVEAARVAAAAAAGLTGAMDFDAAAPALVERLAMLVDDIASL